MFGALIGTVGSTAAAFATGVFARAQTRAQIASARAQWQLDNRRQAYQELIASARSFENAWWELGHALSLERDGEEVFARIVQLYPGLTASEAGVQILGPPPAASAAREVIKHLSEMDTAGTGWYQATNKVDSTRECDRFWALHAASGGKIAAFWTAARDALEER